MIFRPYGPWTGDLPLIVVKANNTRPSPNQGQSGLALGHDSTASRAPPGQPKKKTLTELDEELRQKMEGLSGEGGASGVEYEDGKPAAMKRSVRENMFRYI